ncbi:hypothetical protein F7734_15115 [Scytonema sp. UIC 10036]|uniref:hypothetical protein n=1 Tax=Scytonema sp. UIC 10036 TaxID=2304196 RepID=UPI0012DA5295|nr:hypothetical protein [Scytonema sp. UIC 10036]MUG93677.1 hypothetical protein [Scytonema sp. UIC 10036]
MIISDLNYLETAESANIVGGSSKYVNLKTSVKQDFDVDIKINAKKDIKSEIDAKTDIKGNSAYTVFENTAFGKNTYVQSDVTNVVIEGYLSESSGTLVAAANR